MKLSLRKLLNLYGSAALQLILTSDLPREKQAKKSFYSDQ